MTRVESSILVNAPSDEVWEFISDIDRLPEWAPDINRVAYESDGEIGEGTVYRESGGSGPRDAESEWKITEWDPPRRQVHRTDEGPLKLRVTFELDPSNGYTRLHQSIEFRVLPNLRPFGAILDRLFVRRKVQSNANSMVQNIKHLVETEQQ